MSAAEIISDTLNSRAIKVMMRTGDNKLVVDDERTKLGGDDLTVDECFPHDTPVLTSCD